MVLLTDEEKNGLNKLMGRHNVSQQIAKRARVVLAAGFMKKENDAVFDDQVTPFLVVKYTSHFWRRYCQMKKLIKVLPLLGPVTKIVYRKWIKHFRGSENYWIKRYESGGNSGFGSYGKLAQFKAEILNEFVQGESVITIIEYGCGDGNQLKLAKYPSYFGFDVSSRAIALCKEAFSYDTTKTFDLIDRYNGERAQLTLSIDVIFHLIEDKVFCEHMERLFDSAEKFVIIYSSNTNNNGEGQDYHVKHRKFSEWVEEQKPEWELRSHIPNKYPFTGDHTTSSFADFYIYEKTEQIISPGRDLYSALQYSTK